MKRKTKRLWIILGSMASFAIAIVLILSAFSSNLVYFKAPSQLINHPTVKGTTIRLGGMVLANSLHYSHKDQTPTAQFQVTDGQAAIEVHYTGILPDLFREGQSVIAIGTLDKNNIFTASEVLAKHDETYMPKEVADALRKSGKWDPKYGPPPDAATWDHMTQPK
ncbi:Cytochrome c biogenesis protein CcmE (CcmE) (PDB:1J6Q) [Commensalibacter communis]|uniref:Cytochrome c-type biogenesis protein CcmE n=1 Tax=Commensalibacter communis TaxID=2972786 RepID=A0A9W4X5U2_9PROT|nr:cytochrome c maturation protein CcmE [Commensalibacter communis]CAI3925187.1 Cytochrome c biogenesis protein CcmE (CcmE) (PDB:1J6Q) [Commensalibacter communis]CAI3925216.1 Cytochrome c biogenesis protein CcmE (CcmE) (PDB:1J6Q) [Commensalibacter communis]CAI3928116.1 Cytochrome c biogenesis protein CcmE (CcmE) (PDB:1J6Q) [Commensalibacter communis]CAI3929472.1 Cytochrome c biogenesis protein CcmE (CcmE) (PDB:1J6Q) [Commensalibacter communis]CAI3929608.1 Cytochrome c biogenesis protein CcmE (